MCTPKIISSFALKIRIIIIKTSVTFLLVNRLSVCTRQTDCQLSVHNNRITVHRNLVYNNNNNNNIYLKSNIHKMFSRLLYNTHIK